MKLEEYHSKRSHEEPFLMNGTKWEFVNVKGRPERGIEVDIGVYSFASDLTYNYHDWREAHGLN